MWGGRVFSSAVPFLSFLTALFWLISVSVPLFYVFRFSLFWAPTSIGLFRYSPLPSIQPTRRSWLSSKPTRRNPTAPTLKRVPPLSIDTQKTTVSWKEKVRLGRQKAQVSNPLSTHTNPPSKSACEVKREEYQEQGQKIVITMVQKGCIGFYR